MQATHHTGRVIVVEWTMVNESLRIFIIKTVSNSVIQLTRTKHTLLRVVWTAAVLSRSCSHSSSVKLSNALSTSSSSASESPSSLLPSLLLSSSSSSLSSTSSRVGRSSSWSSGLGSGSAGEVVEAAEANGQSRAFTDNCIMWLKHQTQLTDSNTLGNRCKHAVCLLFDVMLSPTNVKI